MSELENHDELNLKDAPILTPNPSSFSDIISYNCTECSSSIEILSISGKKGTIQFRCLNNKSHGIKIMPIKEYFEKMLEHKIQNFDEDKCTIHSSSKNNTYISYCFDCNRNLCKQCLKSRIHINHNKNNIIEIQPIEEELNLIEEIIKYYKNKVENLMVEKMNMIEKLKKSLEEKKKEENIRIKNLIIENNSNKEVELLSSKNKFMLDIKEIYRKYKNEMFKRKNKYQKEINKINNSYKLINEKDIIKHKSIIEKMNQKCIEVIQNLKYDDLIENAEYTWKINEVVINTYNSCNDNYYNSININNLLLSNCKDEFIKNKLMKNILKDKYQEILDLILTKKKEDINVCVKKTKEESIRKNIISEKIESKIKEINKKNELKIEEIYTETEEKIKEIHNENKKKIKDEEKKLMDFLRKISIYFINFIFIFLISR
jgi:hypothetical protein